MKLAPRSIKAVCHLAASISLYLFLRSITMLSEVQFFALVALIVPVLASETPAAAAAAAASGSAPVTPQDRQHNKRGVLDLGLGLDASPYAYASPAVAAPVAVSKVSYATAHYPKQVIAGYGGAYHAHAHAAPGIAFGGPVTYADAPYYSKLGYAAAPLGYLDGGVSYAGYPGLSYNGYAAIPAPGLGYGALPY